MQTTTLPANVSDDFPRDESPGIVPGAQPKVCAVMFEGKYVAGQTAIEREERWSICEDLAHQLVPKALKEASAHPEQSQHVILERVRAAVASKGWVSDDELRWLIVRLRALLDW